MPLVLRSFFLMAALSSVAFGQQYQWRHALPVSCNSVAFNPLSNGQILFAGPGYGTSGIYRSDDGGYTWALHNTPGLTFPLTYVHQVFCVPSDTSVVLAVTPNQLFRSTNGGTSWSMVDSLRGIDGEVIAWHAIGDTVYYGQNFGEALWKSGDHGATWFKTGFANPDSIGLCSLDVSQDTIPTIIQGSVDDGVSAGILARTTDDGFHWSVTLHADTGSHNEAEVPKVVFSKYATDTGSGRHDVALAIRWLSTYRSLVASTNGGSDWETLNAPSTYPWALDIDQRAAMISKPGDEAYPLPLHFFIGLFAVRPDTIPNGMVQETTDAGTTWHSTNFPPISVPDTNVHLVWVLKYDTTSGRIAVATDSGIYIADTVTSSVAEEGETQVPDLVITKGLGFLEVEAPQMILSATIYDMLGRVVRRIQPAVNGSRSFTMQTSGFAPGAYALEVTMSGSAPAMRMLTLP
jgi:hypothetical protein